MARSQRIITGIIATGTMLIVLLIGIVSWQTVAHGGGTGQTFLQSVQQTVLSAAASSPQPRAAAPVTLSIPSVHVHAAVEEVGMTPDRHMDVPQSVWDVGWFDLGPRPGETGNAVIDGHLDSKTGTAVFWNLKKVKPGDDIEVTAQDGTQYHFTVTRTQSYNEDAAPLTEIFGSSGGIHLNLITCGGKWDKAKHQYQERLAVFTDLASAP